MVQLGLEGIDDGLYCILADKVFVFWKQQPGINGLFIGGGAGARAGGGG